MQKKDVWDIVKGVVSSILWWGIPAMIGLLAWIQKMPWFLIPLSILAAIGCVLFIVNQWRQRKEKGNISKLSDKKIELLIRDWLDLPGFSVERVPAKLPIKFNFLFIDKHKRSINIVRDTVLPEIIQLLARFVISSNDAPLNESVVNKIAGNIKLEIARLGVEYGFDGTPNPHNSVHFLVPVILDDSLNKFYFRQKIFLLLRAMVLTIEISIQTKEYIEKSLPPISTNPPNP
jgi:hypothetical protein